MRNLKIVLCLLFTICLAACSDENDIQFTKGDIPRDIAYELALKELNVSLKDVDIWATKEKLPANTKMEILHFELTSPATESWLFFVDDMPMMNWGHDCRYAFVDMNGKVHIYKKTQGPDYDIYKMECINISDITKGHNEIFKQQKKSTNKVPKSRSTTTPSENHYAIILNGG